MTLCRHRGTEQGLVPSQRGWFNFANTLGLVNLLHAMRAKGEKGKSKGQGKGRGGGNAPGPAEYTEADVIEVVTRANGHTLV